MELGKYKHYKGKFYNVLSVAIDKETKEEMVVYQCLYDTPDYGSQPVFVQPKKRFCEEVNGVPRFTFVENESSPERVEQLMHFLREIDKLKNVERKIHTSTLKRYESTAEHSWHLAMFVLLLHTELPSDLDLFKMVKLALVHDLVEIYAGDTMPFNEDEMATKHERELAAAKKLFALLPSDFQEEFMGLFWEYENTNTPEAKFVCSFDKLQAVQQCVIVKGKPYEENNLVYSDIDGYTRPQVEHNAVLLSLYEKLLKEAVDEGYLK
jgi:putative hydrolases of HD superfamily